MSESYTPALFIAAAIPYGSQDPAEAAYHSAAAALDDEAVNLITSVADDRVWFLAARAGEFLRHPAADTPLAAALPGMPGHQGECAYVLAIAPDLYGMVVRQKDALKSVTGTEREVLAFSQQFGLPLVQLDDTTPAAAWAGYRTLQLERDRKTVRTALFSGSVLAIANVMMLLALHVYAGLQARAAAGAGQQLHTNLQKAAAMVEQASQQPVLHALEQIQQVSDVALQTGGHVAYYKLDKGMESFEIDLPAHTADSAFTSLGRGLSVSQDPASAALIVRKGAPL